jgi:6-phosphogluconolactonase
MSTVTTRVYLGTTGRDGGRGVYLATLDLQAGTLSEPQLAAEAAGPSFLALHPNRKWLYSVGQFPQAGGKSTGGAYSFAIDEATGSLELMNLQPSGGEGPCHIAVDPAGRCVLLANYSSGSVAVLPIAGDGKLAQPSCVVQHTGSSIHPRRQQGPHAHSIQPHPGGQFAFSADLGIDRLLTYRFDSQAGQLELLEDASAALAPGAGPRHFAFHPALATIYVVNELDSTVVALKFDPRNQRMDALQTLTTLPYDFEGENYPSEIAVHPSGRFLYAANRGHDSLAVYRIDEQTGTLEDLGQVAIEGKFPRHFAIDPTGRYLIAAHQNSNNLSVFAISLATGRPHFTGQHIDLPKPMCVLYMPG